MHGTPACARHTRVRLFLRLHTRASFAPRFSRTIAYTRAALLAHDAHDALLWRLRKPGEPDYARSRLSFSSSSLFGRVAEPSLSDMIFRKKGKIFLDRKPRQAFILLRMA